MAAPLGVETSFGEGCDGNIASIYNYLENIAYPLASGLGGDGAGLEGADGRSD